MPLQIPKIDDRRYQDLLDEALARIPVHNPEWTNFNHSDPGVTLIETFAFMTESLLYRANLIPERNRLKFLQLLGIQLNPATSARGLVQFSNENTTGTITLDAGLETTAEQIPFRTERGLDVLPIEGVVYYKRPIKADAEVEDRYRQLYASFQGADSDEETELSLYETTLLEANEKGVSLAEESIDNSLWIALLAQENVDPEKAGKEIANKILSLGIIPALDEKVKILPVGGQEANSENDSWLSYELPKLPPGGILPNEAENRRPEYKPLDTKSLVNVLNEPGTVELTLPTEDELKMWSNLDPLELGADDFPPTLEDTKLNERLITWIRLRATSKANKFRFLWVGINAATVTQRASINNEILSDGTGEPDQTAKLSQAPVLPNSVKLLVENGDEFDEWSETDDLLTAGSEVVSPDLRKPPGAKPSLPKNPKVFTVDAEAGEIKFGDGLRGMRPPLGAKIRVSFDYSAGILGNVGKGAINSGSQLPAGVKVVNPIRTWGGADSEQVSDGEKQITRFLQHRERLVTVRDFETITLRTPGVLIGRVEVIPAFNPQLSPNEPGDAPGAVTVMLIPRYDAEQPDAPVPDRLFLDSVCRHLDERRLATTEIILRGPTYKGIWISVGINVISEKKAFAEIREAVKKELIGFLSPINPLYADSLENDPILQFDNRNESQSFEVNKGWRLRKPVNSRELLAIAGRVSGVMFVNDVLLAEGNNERNDIVPMSGLELPRILGISVTVGDPLPLAQLRGTSTDDGTGSGNSGGQKRKRRIVPIPVIPEEC